MCAPPLPGGPALGSCTQTHHPEHRSTHCLDLLPRPACKRPGAATPQCSPSVRGTESERHQARLPSRRVSLPCCQGFCCVLSESFSVPYYQSMFLFPAFRACLSHVARACFCSLLLERVSVPHCHTVFLFPAVGPRFCSLLWGHVFLPCCHCVSVPCGNTFLFHVIGAFSVPGCRRLFCLARAPHVHGASRLLGCLHFLPLCVACGAVSRQESGHVPLPDPGHTGGPSA